jgi:hypothetical protein
MPISGRHDHRRKGVAMSDTRFRWVRRPSEEALLGLSDAYAPRANDARPASPPFSFLAADADAPARKRHLGARELAAVGAVGAVVWLAVYVAGLDSPSQARGPSGPTIAASEVSRTLAADRRGHASRPRKQPGAAEKEAAAAGKGEHAEEGRTEPQPPNDDDTDGSTGEDEGSPPPPPPPPTEPSDSPLLEANVPGVGSVTVEQPELTDADDVLPATPTLPTP